MTGDNPAHDRMFKVPRYTSSAIESYEVIKTTEHFVFYYSEWCGKKYERRERHDGRWFKTWTEAHAALLARQTEEVRRTEEQLQRAKSLLGEIRVMKEAT